jgi:hypothetical protein
MNVGQRKRSLDRLTRYTGPVDSQLREIATGPPFSKATRWRADAANPMQDSPEAGGERDVHNRGQQDGEHHRHKPTRGLGLFLPAGVFYAAQRYGSPE